MDDILEKLLSFPPFPPPQQPLSNQQYDEAVKSHIVTVKNISDSKLLQQTSSGDALLDVIQPGLSSISYAYVLLAHISGLSKGNKNIDLENVWSKMGEFMANFDARQIRYIGTEFLRIIEKIVFFAHRQQLPHLALTSVRDAVRRLDPSGAMLTSTHILLSRLIIESAGFGAALGIFDKSILYFPGSSNQPKTKYLCDMTLPPTAYIVPSTGLTTKLKAIDVLDYFFVTGLIFIGLRDWENALKCLENAVTYPCKEGGVSRIMVEAYKKWLMISLLLDGKPRLLPKSTSPAAAKLYHIIARPYEAVAQLFEGGPASRLKAEVDAGSRVWSNDYNYGLIICVLGAFQQYQIKDLANIYSTISIPEVHSQTSSAETGQRLPSVDTTEELVREMITNGRLNATLSTSPNSHTILAFVTGLAAISENEVQRELAASTQRIHALTQEIKQTDRMLTHDKEYIKFAQKQKRAGRGDGRIDHDSGMNPGMEWNPMEDEDLMDSNY